MKEIAIVCLLLISAQLFAQTKEYSLEEIERWQTVGRGNGYVTHGQFFMEEVEGSKGFMLLSSRKYKDVVLRYEVMTLNPATVLVAILNASDIGDSSELTITGNSDSFGFWASEVEDYMFGFRVMAHNSTPFLRKYPIESGKNNQIGLAEKDVMHSGWRHQVECGKKGNRLWLKIDGVILIDVEDEEPLNTGKIAIRVRGTASELGKCMIRNMEIEGEEVD
ncbi:hypothetical protein OU798_22365 [Prolixibacteraceae bacterium Z1-6]|uniref:3-keto-disaccharide hydrolase domain-containing protein n=1 Tax=Draconibacterium aestuarii TaxID=2998507 RepID=A0A9X3F9N4_9BACT|nr:hypothetical protein [Prolixibacteraceae bacterium Z1-6]